MSPRPVDRSIAEEIDEEMRAHLELSAFHRRLAGADPDEALSGARERFGNPARVRASVLAVHQPTWKRWVGRVSRALALALAIGTLTAALNLLAGLTARTPLTFRSGGEWVSVWPSRPMDPNGFSALSTYAEYEALKRASGPLESVHAVRYETRVASGSFPTTRARIKRVSPGYLGAMGAGVQIGDRLAVDADGAPVAVLSYQAWADWFDRSATAVGEIVVLGGVPHTIVGVLARDVEFYYESQIVAPLATLAEAEAAAPRLLVSGRLRSGVSVDDGEARLAQGALGGPRLVPAPKAFALPFLGAASGLVILSALVSASALHSAFRERRRVRAPAEGWRHQLVDLAVPLCGVTVGMLLGVSLTPTVGAAVLEGSRRVFDFGSSLAEVIMGVASAAAIVVLLSLMHRGVRRGRTGRIVAGVRSPRAWIALQVSVASIVFSILIPAVREGALEQLSRLPGEDLFVAGLALDKGDPTAWRDRGVGPVEGWALASALPGVGEPSRTRVWVESGPSSDAGAVWVTPNFFEIAGLETLLGAGFAATAAGDQSSLLVQYVIDVSLARELFGDADPTGRRLDLSDTRTSGTVVGVVEAVRYGADAAPALYRLATEGEAPALLALRRDRGGLAPGSMGHDIIGPVPLRSMARAERRFVSARLAIALALGLAQVLILFETLSNWRGGAADSSRGPHDVAKRRAMVRAAAGGLFFPVLVGLGVATLVSTSLSIAAPWAARPSPLGLLLTAMLAAAVLGPHWVRAVHLDRSSVLE